MKKIIFGFFLIAIALTTLVVEVKADNYSTVTLTMNPNQSNAVRYPYDAYEQVTMNETMSYFNGEVTSCPNDGLVSLQINDSTENAMVIRTLNTGTGLPLIIPAAVTTAYLSDSSGNQITSIGIQSQTNEVIPYVYLAVINNLATPQSMLVTLNVYDSNGVPISVASQPLVNVAPSAETPSYALIPFSIPSYTHYGTAYAYVDVYSKWPSEGGVPLSVEKEFEFTVTGGTPFSGTPASTNSYNYQPWDNFNMTFRLPQQPALGTYLAWSTTAYYPQAGSSPVLGSQSTEFSVAQLADVNGDGVVNFNDILYFVGLYINSQTTGTYYAQIDFEHTGTINFNDVLLFVGYYILAWSS